MRVKLLKQNLDYRKQEAIDALKKSIANGFWQFDLIACDPDFNNLRDEPEFKAIIKQRD